jgi:hypothetical protein
VELAWSSYRVSWKSIIIFKVHTWTWRSQKRTFSYGRKQSERRVYIEVTRKSYAFLFYFYFPLIHSVSSSLRIIMSHNIYFMTRSFHCFLRLCAEQVIWKTEMIRFAIISTPDIYMRKSPLTYCQLHELYLRHNTFTVIDIRSWYLIISYNNALSKLNIFLESKTLIIKY